MRLTNYLIGLFFMLLIAHASAADVAKLQSIRVSATAEKTRLVFVLDHLPAHKVFSLANPSRLVVDFSDTHLVTSLNIPLSVKSLVTKLRSGNGDARSDANTLRIVLDLKVPVTKDSLRFFILPGKGATAQQRLVLDLYAQSNASQSVVTKEVATDIKLPVAEPLVTTSAKNRSSTGQDAVVASMNMTSAILPVATTKKTLSYKQELATSTKIVSSQAAAPTDDQDDETPPEPVAKMPSTKDTKTIMMAPSKTRDIVIVIDPGHGGKDPGASGTSGTHEKNVVLAISQRLAELINKQPGMHAVLTRQGDYFVTLRGRLNLARKDKADMFMAIHADAFPNNDATGASVFALSASGASSEAARWLAEKENYSELGGVSLGDKSDLLRSVLLDLSQTATISLSLQLGSSCLQELNRITNLHHAGVEQARFVVLKSPDIPSVLVETGFITNVSEEKRLNDVHYQQQLAVALSEGIRRYFMQNPPPGTVFAVKHAAATQYTVKKGDNVVSVAKDYGMSAQALRDANQLSSNKLTPGQLLHIPLKTDMG